MTTSLVRPRCSTPVSPRLSALFGAVFTAGLAYGLSLYADRSSTRDEHVAGTAAWWPHAILAVIVVVSAICVRIHRRRNRRRGSLLLAPIGVRAARRVRRTFVSGNQRWRAVAAVPPAALLLYCVFRIGVQIVAGFDPSFTVNAWGGPGYLGALIAHCLDAFVLMAVSAWTLDRLLLGEIDG